ncbi:hypothetical protein BAR153v2_011110 [Bartonella sp. AR 15-3]|nr:hypothetical protein BAR153v2_011110 [Bartonella sp. AR 15-3]
MATEHLSAVKDVVQEAQCLYRQPAYRITVSCCRRSITTTSCVLTTVLNALYKHFTKTGSFQAAF